MANVKITELTAITAPASSDVLAIVDVDADVTKKVTIANLVGSAAPGSFGAPSFGFADDDDTGMYRAAADQLGFATTGAERFRIDDAGNLHISGDSKYLYLSSDDNQWIRADASTDFIQIGTSNSERLRIDSSGRVGIGTNSPGFVLDVQAATGTAGIKSTTGTNLAYLSFTNTSGNAFVGLESSAGGNFSTGTGAYALCLVHQGAYPISFATGNAERMRIDSSGRLLVGTTTPGLAAGDELTLAGSGNSGLSIRSGSSDSGSIYFSDGTAEIDQYKGLIQYTHNGDYMRFLTANNERMRIDSSGNVGIGSASPSNMLHIEGSSPSIRLKVTSGPRHMISPFSGDLYIESDPDNTSASTNTIFTVDGTERMRIDSSGNVGIGNSAPGAKLQIESTSDQLKLTYPGIASYIHEVDSSGNYAISKDATERLRIDSSGNVLVGTTTNGSSAKGIALRNSGELLATRDGGPAMLVNRLSSDGTLVDFRQANTSEGSISVSGGTVSYNGAHLSRWSQLSGGAERTEILRGSVLSNLDEMCEWGDEDNEQLNRMQVSSVEGDANVAGVFQAWDDDDDTYTNDFYCAMTGDFVIRIAKGTTVARGDLLMSAGDGTAKPQDDDIVRSKTIAKVTSTTVSETYSDGSYCVPCVLMAC